MKSGGQPEIEFDLKMAPVAIEEVERGDIIFKYGSIW